VFGKNQQSFYAALLFAVNPVTLFGSAWISGRGYSISAMLGLLFYGLGVWGIPFYLIAIGYGMSAMPIPVVCLNWMSFLPIIFIAAFFTGQRNDAIAYRKRLINQANKHICFNKVIIAVKTYAYYFTHCLFPRRLGMYHTFLFTYGLQDDDIKFWTKLDGWFWGGLALIGAVGYAIITDFYGLRLPLLWFTASISIWTNFYMINQTIADRYAYIACIGLMLLLGKIVTPIVFTVVFTYYLTRNWLQLNAFKSDDLFLEYNTYDINHPDQIFVYTLKGDKERALLRPFMALETWSKGLKHRPNDTRLHFFIAKVLAELGFYKEAEYHLDEMEKHPYTSDIKKGITSAIPALREFIQKGRDAKSNLH
jgi:hypothetical protein